MTSGSEASKSHSVAEERIWCAIRRLERVVGYLESAHSSCSRLVEVGWAVEDLLVVVFVVGAGAWRSSP